MSVLRRLTVAQIRGSKSRFVVTVIGVMLSAAMIAAVLLGSDSVMDAMRRGVAAQTGDYIWQACGRAQTIGQLMETEPFESKGFAQQLPWGSDPGLTDSMGCIGMGGDAWQMMNTHLTDGRLPETPDEALIPTDMASANQLSPGSSLTLPDRTLTVTGVYDYCSVSRQIYLSDTTYVVLVFLETPQQDPAGGETVTFWGGEAQPDGNFFDAVEQLDSRFTVEDDIFYGSYNDSLLAWSGISVPHRSRDQLVSLIGGLRIFLLVLIGVGAALMVSNAFSLSLAERRRTLGLLASAGATPAQKSGIIFYEALAAGLIGIPAGLVLACGGLAVTFLTLQPAFDVVAERLFGDMSLDLSLKIQPFWLILSGAFSAAVLLASAWIPAERAGRTTPIDAIRGTKEIRLNARALRGGRLFGLVFGPEGMLARKNARRSVHRYRATLLSLTLSVVLLVTASSFAGYLERSYGMGHQASDYDVTATLSNYDTTRDAAALPIWDGLLHPRNADAVQLREHVQWGRMLLPADRIGEQTLRLGWDATAQRVPDLYDAANYWVEAGQDSDTLAMQPYLLVLPDEMYAGLAGQDATADGSTIDCVVINRCYMPGADGGMIEVEHQMELAPGDRMDWDFNTLPVTLQVAAVADDPPEELVQTNRSPYVLTLATSRSAADAVFARFAAERGEYCPRYFDLCYVTDDPAALADELNALYADTPIAGASLLVTNQRAENLLVKALLMLVRVVLYGFVAMISLICAANIANTVSSGMALRRRETAMLCANGLTPKGLRKMLFLESGIYGIQALVIGLPVSAVLSWLVWRRVMRVYYFSFSLPWGAMVAAAVGMLLLTLLAALPALLHAARHPPAEDFRTEEAL